MATTKKASTKKKIIKKTTKKIVKRAAIKKKKVAVKKVSKTKTAKKVTKKTAKKIVKKIIKKIVTPKAPKIKKIVVPQEFKSGENIVYPTHGVGRILTIEKFQYELVEVTEVVEFGIELLTISG